MQFLVGTNGTTSPIHTSEGQSREMGAVGLEPTETEVEGFTVPCNCRYATPPRKIEDAGERN